ncbi:hypothetical protein L288_17630 [Sphingobium quisquiliarum P25]|uniref:Uncharacterized protein n=1 Tax=Sphingobium quisquiliarum P25 TaxID=1329909 RepID=T0HVS1_9SPHN|nr:hypothetical protein L288_17630 [Sphingobium quisquiliarum P25]
MPIQHIKELMRLTMYMGLFSRRRRHCFLPHLKVLEVEQAPARTAVSPTIEILA